MRELNARPRLCDAAFRPARQSAPLSAFRRLILLRSARVFDLSPSRHRSDRGFAREGQRLRATCGTSSRGRVRKRLLQLLLVYTEGQDSWRPRRNSINNCPATPSVLRNIYLGILPLSQPVKRGRAREVAPVSAAGGGARPTCVRTVRHARTPPAKKQSGVCSLRCPILPLSLPERSSQSAISDQSAGSLTKTEA